jgi:hypothetical protein
MAAAMAAAIASPSRLGSAPTGRSLRVTLGEQVGLGGVELEVVVDPVAAVGGVQEAHGDELLDLAVAGEHGRPPHPRQWP